MNFILASEIWDVSEDAVIDLKNLQAIVKERVLSDSDEEGVYAIFSWGELKLNCKTIDEAYRQLVEGINLVE